MIVNINLPELTEYSSGFPGHWVGKIAGVGLNGHRVNALTSSYIRYIEHAMRSYRESRTAVSNFWDEKSYSRGSLSLYFLSISSLEMCITYMHRAIRCLKALLIRGRDDVPASFTALISPKPEFVKDQIANRITNVRDMIHHVEGKVHEGTIAEGESFFVRWHGLARFAPRMKVFRCLFVQPLTKTFF